jgi:hypothetical protein
VIGGITTLDNFPVGARVVLSYDLHSHNRKARVFTVCAAPDGEVEAPGSLVWVEDSGGYRQMMGVYSLRTLDAVVKMNILL